jgi:hypothetical protein
MRLRISSDILSFLEDLERIYRLIRKKNAEANYILIMGAFSKIFEDEIQTRLEDLHEAASGSINAIVSPLGDAIEKKLGPEVDTQVLLYELVSFTEIFNRLSPDLPFSDDVIEFLAPPLIKRFGNAENYEEIRTLLKDHRDQFQIDELESALEGGIHAQNVWGLEFSWEQFLEPLRALNELIAQNQNLMRVPLDVLSALEAPVKEKPAQAEYSQLTLYQKPYGMVRRRNDENQVLVKVDSRSRSEVQLTPFTDFMPRVYTNEQKYKEYFSITAGALALLVIILATVIFSVSSPPLPGGNTTGDLLATKNGTLAASAPNKTMTPVPTLIPAPTKKPTPVPTPQYVTVESVMKEPDTSPKSNKILFEKPAPPPNISYDSKEYITIFKNNQSHTLDNSFKISFDLKNPPMVIRFNVIPHNITDIKWFEPRDYQKKIDTAIVTRPDEFSWFEVKISNESGIYDMQGWGRIYGNPLSSQEIVIRNPGMYQIEFSGQNVIAGYEVLVKKEGNINS